jgi:hypothetical protein
VLGFIGAAVVAVAVTTLVYNVPGDTEGVAVTAGILVLAALMRAVTQSVLDQAGHDEE